MAYLGFDLRLSDGVSTVYLGTASPLPVGAPGSQLVAYPIVEAPETLRVASRDADGAAIVGVRRENVSEGATISIGYTFADAQWVLGTINRLLRQAEERQKYGRGLPVYLEVDTGTGDFWRSEILAGRAAPDAATLGGYWRTRGQLQVAVKWLRRSFWEGPEIELRLRNTSFGAASYAPGGVVVFNHFDPPGSDDGGHYNWFEVDPSNLGFADLPAPMRMTLQAFSSGVTVCRVVVAGGLLDLSLPWGMDGGGPVIEGETCADGTRFMGADETDASGGAYRSLNAPGTSARRFATWPLGAFWLAGAGREFVRVFMRIVGEVPAGARVRLKLNSGVGMIWSGPEVILEGGHELQDLGVVQLPPGNLMATANLTLDLWGHWATGDIGIDYVAFLPLVSYRRYAPLIPTVGVAYWEQLVDDGLAGQVYVQRGAGAVPDYAARGAQLLVYPHTFKANRFSVFWEDGSGAALAKWQVKVQAWYRPRRASL